MTRRWSELSPETRRFLLVTGAIEGVLKAVALVDLVRRPQEEVRGAKWKWATAIVLVNSFGAVPVAYFLRGRRKS